MNSLCNLLFQILQHAIQSGQTRMLRSSKANRLSGGRCMRGADGQGEPTSDGFVVFKNSKSASLKTFAVMGAPTKFQEFIHDILFPAWETIYSRILQV